MRNKILYIEVYLPLNKSSKNKNFTTGPFNNLRNHDLNTEIVWVFDRTILIGLFWYSDKTTLYNEIDETCIFYNQQEELGP